MNTKIFFMLLGVALLCGASSFAQTPDWNTAGNSLTGSPFLGTTNAMDLVLKTNNITRMTINALGNVGIGMAPHSSGVYKVSISGLLRVGEGGNNGAIDVKSGATAGIDVMSGTDVITTIDFKGFSHHAQDYWGRIKYTDGTGFDFYTAGPATAIRMRLKDDGKVVIGDPTVYNSTSSDYKLFVQTGINTPKILIGDPAIVATTSPTTLNDYKLFVDGGIIAEKVKVALCCGVDWADYVFAPDYQLLSLDSVETYITTNQHLPGVPSSEEVQTNGIEVAAMDALLLQKIEELTLYMIELKKQNETLQNKIQILKDETND